jgi:formylglycine-generating enzyme required for sulfatase activity
MSFRVVPAGSFLMGSTRDEVDAVLTTSTDLKGAEAWIQDRVRSEAPARKVTLAEPFLIGTHEVTVGQFREFVKAAGHKTHAEQNGGGAVWDNAAKKWGQDPEAVWHNPKFAVSESLPAVFLNPADVRAFCAWLGQQDGRTYALPTEEQWEFACRAGTTTRWWFGDDPDGMKDAGWTVEVSFGKHRPVGQKKANSFGLFDLHGSATEMATTPQGDVYERGGQANETAWRARSAWRNPVAEDARPHGRRGFRVAVVGDPAPRAKE